MLASPAEQWANCIARDHEAAKRERLRDQFACAALIGLLSGNANSPDGVPIGKYVWEIADEVLAARDQPSQAEPAPTDDAVDLGATPWDELPTIIQKES